VIEVCGVRYSIVQLHPSHTAPMPVHLAAYDSNGSVVLLLAGDDTKPLSFPLAALLGSVHTYAVDSDWQLQEVSLADATITYVRCCDAPQLPAHAQQPSS
jgi:hypothetical protein